MWEYEKRLQFPVNIKTPDSKAAQIIISQYGGPDGELGASLRYLSQSYSMSNKKVANLLRDIATEEMAHLEMVGTIVMQLTKDLTIDQIEREGFDTYFVDHTVGVYPQAAAGVPYTAAFMQSKGDPITDLFEDMGADATTTKEQPPFQKARKPLI